LRHQSRLSLRRRRLPQIAVGFKYGYLVGKLAALEWALGVASGSDIGSHFDYEDWLRELKEGGDAIRGQG
jgi:hypothetical protein